MNDPLTNFAAVVSDRPLAKLFCENPTFSCGLNLLDYFHVQRFPWAARRSNLLSGGGRKLTDVLGTVIIGSEELGTAQDLWNLFLAARRDLIALLSDARFHCGIRLEDVILIDALIRHGLIDGNLRIVNVTDEDTFIYMMRMQGSSQLITRFLRDLASYCATLPADEATRAYLSRAEVDEDLEYGNDASPYRSLGDVAEYLKGRGDDAKEVREEFVRRLQTQFEPEINGRFWTELVKQQGGARHERAHDEQALRAVGVPADVISAAGNAEDLLANLQDTLKNSLGNCEIDSAIRLCSR